MENSRIENFSINPDNEDDDYGSYFLQPSSSPYNLAEKVQQANMDLFNNAILESSKNPKVTFKEELATYEPELTDDDVVSIESESNATDSRTQSPQSQVLEYKSSMNVLKLNIFDINEEGEEILDEIIEDIEPDDDGDESPIIINDNNNMNIMQSSDQQIMQQLNYNQVENNDKFDNTTLRLSSRSLNNRKNKIRKKSPRYQSIDCRSQCIEKLDFDLSMSIRKLQIHEKTPSNFPLLKLQPRKCCDENKARNSVNLPTYNGMRSEYGLSSAALQKREKRKEIIKLKEEKRQQLLEEYKNRKNQQNEEVFCQWLKDVARRRKEAVQKQKIDRWNKNSIPSPGSGIINAKQPLSPNVINFPTRMAEKTKEMMRPRTANEFVPTHNVKRARRPHTSPACVFIEVPHKLLKRGIHIGDLLVTNSNHLTAKKMHILSLSS